LGEIVEMQGRCPSYIGCRDWSDEKPNGPDNDLSRRHRVNPYLGRSEESRPSTTKVE
jgi:hypothetical protein